MNRQLIDRVRHRLATDGAEPSSAAIAAAVRAEADGVLADGDLLAVLRRLHTEMTGIGILEPLLRTPNVTDIMVTSPSSVWVDCGGGLVPVLVHFDDEAAVRRLAQRLALQAGRRIDESSPWVDGHLRIAGSEHTLRLHAILAPLATDGTVISLRVLRPTTQRLATLAASGAIDDGALDLLTRIVHARLAFLVTGGTGVGKTTLLAAMLGEVRPTHRMICVEDASELAPQHPHVVRLVSRSANIEGRGEVTVRDLLRQALRMRPDRIVVGEVRGAEVVDLLTALNTGHDGGCGTLHANSPAEVPARLEALAALGGLSREALHSQLAAALDVVVHISRTPQGARQVAQIAVLRRDAAGWVCAVPVWTRRAGLTEHYPAFDAQLRGAPW